MRSCLFVRACALAILLSPALSVAKSFDPTDPTRKLSGSLRTLGAIAGEGSISAGAAARISRVFERNPNLRTDELGRVQVYVEFDVSSRSVIDRLALRGLAVETSAPDLRLISGWILPSALVEIAADPAVRLVRPVIPPVSNAGSVMSEGDAILGANQVRSLGYNGTGVKVGVISDDVDNLTVAQSTADLPAVTVLQRTPGPGDEGTAMLEIVHDLAPGSDLYFYTGSNSSLDMREGIRALAAAGCKVIVDDIGYHDQPYFEDGFLAQVADSVARAGVFYCTSAGNQAEEHYEHEFVPAGGTSDYHAWDLVSDVGLAVTVSPGETLRLFMQWDDPFDASANDYDLYLYSDEACTALIDTSVDEQSGTQHPFENLYYANTTQSEQTVYVVVHRFSGESRTIELFFLRASSVEHGISAGSVFGHGAARNVVAVAAINANESDNDAVASYSSRGPSLISHPYAEIRLKPDITAIDGVSITGAGGFDNPFYGTSAAAPHLAAIAALILDAHPDWSPADVKQALTSTALDLGNSGPDYTYGRGRVRADRAIGVTFAGPTNVRGTILTQTWTKANSPYRVQALIRVPQGETLTIEPGVDVLFDTDTQFIVEGRLEAIGTDMDSIRFIKGIASEWGGLRIIGGDSSALSYVRISDGYADGSSNEGKGGGLYVVETDVGLTHTVISGNKASWSPDYGYGGGIGITGLGKTVSLTYCTIVGNIAGGNGGGISCVDASLLLENCIIANNSVPEWYRRSVYGGGIYYQGSGACVLNRCVLSDNFMPGAWDAGSAGGGIYASGQNPVITHCTITDNEARQGSGIYYYINGILKIDNSVIWRSYDNKVIEGGWGSESVSYCVVTGNREGIGNVNADPLFVDAANGDYRLQWNSPCIDMGNPASPLDPDGTIADIGAFYFDQSGLTETVKLPAVQVIPNERLTVPIRATLNIVRAVDLAFVVPPRIAVPDTGFVRWHAYASHLGAQMAWSVSDDTVRISLSSNEPITLADAKLAELAFRIQPDAPTDTTAQLVWLPYPHTNIEERSTNFVHGAVTVNPPPYRYGDVNADDFVSAYDASLILRYVVRIVPEIPFIEADVTGNGGISAYDASLVLGKVVDPTYLFPVEGGHLPKPAAHTARMLVWHREGDVWQLRLDNPIGVAAADLEIDVPKGITIRVTGTPYLAYATDGDVLRIATVLDEERSGLIAEITADTPFETPPHVRSASLNEGVIPYGGVVLPTTFALLPATPNPFNPSTTIRYSVASEARVSIIVHDALGRPVRALVAETRPAGFHSITWDGRDDVGRSCASGVYLVRFVAEGITETRRVALVR